MSGYYPCGVTDNDPHFVADPDGDNQQRDDEERQMFEEAQQALKDDHEAFDLWLDELIRQGFEEEFDADRNR